MEKWLLICFGVGFALTAVSAIFGGITGLHDLHLHLGHVNLDFGAHGHGADLYGDKHAMVSPINYHTVGVLDVLRWHWLRGAQAHWGRAVEGTSGGWRCWIRWSMADSKVQAHAFAIRHRNQSGQRPGLAVSPFDLSPNNTRKGWVEWGL